MRGTRWLTTDTCRGTAVTVKEGAVDVRPVAGGRTKRVKAGRSMFVPAPRRAAEPS